MTELSQKTPLKARAATPSKVLLSPNDDSGERARTRAAYPTRRISTSISTSTRQLQEQAQHFSLDRQRILELFHNCIKLASENKINQRNTWELDLINHLSAVVDVSDDESGTNFQKASCTLEASVKIYSYRVDSVHSGMFKFLAGLNRTGSSSEDMTENESEESGMDRKEQQKKIPAAVTLESSFDAFNVKKFDVAFTVDPLYQQTSAQFDEGGAEGLLLNTLSVFDGCHIVFDSCEVPEKNMKSQSLQSVHSSSTIDISFIKDAIEHASKRLLAMVEISGSLQRLLNLLDDPFRVVFKEYLSSNQDNVSSITFTDNQESVDSAESEILDNVDNACDIVFREHDFGCPHLETTHFGFPEVHEHEDAVVDDNTISSHQVVEFLDARIGLPFKGNSWAGPEHWKYMKSKEDLQGSFGDLNNVTLKKKRSRRKKHEPFMIDYEWSAEINDASFNVARDKKSLIFPCNDLSSSITLPEDCHYEPEELVKLFLIPSITCINSGRRKSGNLFERNNDDEKLILECEYSARDIWDERDGYNDDRSGEGLIDGDLIANPQKVTKVDVDYDKTSKEFDVWMVKETLWNCMQAFSDLQEGIEHLDDKEEPRNTVSFKSILNSLPYKSATVADESMSVHICFICLLHLANEHNLRIKDCSGLDELTISNISEFQGDKS